MKPTTASKPANDTPTPSESAELRRQLAETERKLAERKTKADEIFSGHQRRERDIASLTHRRARTDSNVDAFRSRLNDLKQPSVIIELYDPQHNTIQRLDQGSVLALENQIKEADILQRLIDDYPPARERIDTYIADMEAKQSTAVEELRRLGFRIVTKSRGAGLQPEIVLEEIE